MGIVHAITADVHVARADAEQALEHAARASDYAESTDDLDTLAHARLTAGERIDWRERLRPPWRASKARRRRSTARCRPSSTCCPIGSSARRWRRSTRSPICSSPRIAPRGTRRVRSAARVRLLRAIIGRVGARLASGLSPAERDDEARLAREVVSLNNQVDKERERQRPDPDRLAKLEADAGVATAVARRVTRAVSRPAASAPGGHAGRVSPPDLAAIRPPSVDRAGRPSASSSPNAACVGFVLTARRPGAPDLRRRHRAGGLASRVGAYREMIERRQDRNPRRGACTVRPALETGREHSRQRGQGGGRAGRRCCGRCRSRR